MITSIVPSARMHAAMVAGGMPWFKGNIDAAIVNVAGAMLGDPCVHVLSAREDDYVFYFAVPSRQVNRAGGFATELAAALPAHPAYRGNGVYAVQAGAIFVAAVKHDMDLFMLSGDMDTIDATAEQYGLQRHLLPPETEQWPLESAFSQQRHTIAHIAGKVMRAAGWTMGICTLLYLLLSVAEDFLINKKEQLASSQATADIVKQFQYTSPLFEQLAHFQQISASVVRSGGWIEGYQWHPEKDESFEIIMPGWISQDYIEALGKGTIADYSIPDNLVIIRKGNLEKKNHHD